MTRWFAGARWLAALVAVVPAPAWGGEGKTRLEVREADAHEIDPGIDEDSLVVSPDGMRVAYIAKRENGVVAIVDGKPGTIYANLAPIAFSPDGKRYAYKATRHDHKWTFVVDGKEGPLHGNTRAATHVFSPDGSRTAYVADVPDLSAPTRSQYALAVDGVVGKPYQQVEEQPWFSRDGKRLAFAAGAGEGPTFRMFVVVDGVDGPGYRQIGSFMHDVRSKAFTWSPDAKHWGYSAVKAEGGELVVIDGVAGTTYEGVRAPAFSPDGTRWAHPALRKGKWVMVANGQVTGKEYDEIGEVYFGPGVGRLAFAARRGKAWVVVVDGVEGKEYGRVGTYSIRFSPDGKRVVYWATSSPRPPPIFFVLDGVEQGAYENVGANRSFAWSSFSFGADGKQTVFAGQRNGKWVIVTNGVEGTPYEMLPIFTPAIGPRGDVAYAAQKGDSLVLVGNGVETPPYKALLSTAPVLFHGPRSFHALIRDGKRIFRAEVDIRDE